MMKNLISQTIELLKDKVKANLHAIQKNQKQIRSYLRMPVSDQRNAELEEKYALNKVLLAENNDFIHVQITLTNFLEKYTDNEIFEGIKEKVPCTCIGEEDCFDRTIKGIMKFENGHPYFNDDKFYKKLLNYYQEIEDYEHCMNLVQIKQQQTKLM